MLQTRDNNSKINVDAIYVVHGLKGYDVQEKHVNYWLGEKYKLPFEFITDGDASLWTDEQLTYYFENNIREKLTKGALSCTLNHFLCYERMVKNKDKYALIFEDDPFFLGNFVEKFNRMVPEIATLAPCFMVSLENTTLKFPSFRQTKKGKYLYDAFEGRCACAYLIDQAAANAMLNELKKQKCNIIIDHWHNKIIRQNLIKMYWAHPPLVEQGSHNGKMNSTLSFRPGGYIAQIRWLCKKVYKTYFLRIFWSYTKKI